MGRDEAHVGDLAGVPSEMLGATGLFHPGAIGDVLEEDIDGAPLEGTHWLSLEDWVPTPEGGLDGRFVTGCPYQGSKGQSGRVTPKESPQDQKSTSYHWCRVFP